MNGKTVLNAPPRQSQFHIFSHFVFDVALWSCDSRYTVKVLVLSVVVVQAPVYGASSFQDSNKREGKAMTLGLFTQEYLHSTL